MWHAGPGSSGEISTPAQRPGTARPATTQRAGRLVRTGMLERNVNRGFFPKGFGPEEYTNPAQGKSQDRGQGQDAKGVRPEDNPHPAQGRSQDRGEGRDPNGVRPRIGSPTRRKAGAEAAGGGRARPQWGRPRRIFPNRRQEPRPGGGATRRDAAQKKIPNSAQGKSRGRGEGARPQGVPPRRRSPTRRKAGAETRGKGRDPKGFGPEEDPAPGARQEPIPGWGGEARPQGARPRRRYPTRRKAGAEAREGGARPERVRPRGRSPTGRKEGAKTGKRGETRRGTAQKKNPNPGQGRSQDRGGWGETRRGSA